MKKSPCAKNQSSGEMRSSYGSSVQGRNVCSFMRAYTYAFYEKLKVLWISLGTWWKVTIFLNFDSPQIFIPSSNEKKTETQKYKLRFYCVESRYSNQILIVLVFLSQIDRFAKRAANHQSLKCYRARRVFIIGKLRSIHSPLQSDRKHWSPMIWFFLNPKCWNLCTDVDEIII